MSDIMAKEIEITRVAISERGMVIYWGIGSEFGTVAIYKEGDNLYIDSECMGAEFVKKILCSMVDSVVVIE